jgi:hypothetical protein
LKYVCNLLISMATTFADVVQAGRFCLVAFIGNSAKVGSLCLSECANDLNSFNVGCESELRALRKLM